MWFQEKDRLSAGISSGEFCYDRRVGDSMIRKILILLASLTVVLAAAPADEITAALPSIPDARFNLADFGAVGDGKTLNTDAFKSAVAAISKAGGGHLIVPAGTFKTLPFALTSHMDLHLDPGATIKAPETFAEYGIPDPNQAPAQGAGRGAFPRVAPLISCPSGTTDLAITGS